MPSHISIASFHHAERIFCKISESWNLQSVVSPQLENVGETCRTFAPQVLCRVKFFAHPTFTCIESIFSYPHKSFLPPRTRSYSSGGPRPQKRVPTTCTG